MNTIKKLLKSTSDFDLVTGAKNIRIELKKAFPSVTFRVRTSRFSMGNSIGVSWTDGPAAKEVEAIVNKYEYGTFDPMTDCSGVRHTEHTRNYGGAKFVQTNRHLSKQAREKGLKSILAQKGIEFKGLDESYQIDGRWEFGGTLGYRAMAQVSL